MNAEALLYIFESLENENSFLTEKNLLLMLTSFDISKFVKVNEYNIGGVEYSYYQRSDNN